MNKIVINDYIENDPLSEENLDKTLNFLHRFRFLMPEKAIWLYTGYRFEEIQIGTRKHWFVNYFFPNDDEFLNHCKIDDKRAEIVEQVDVLIDGKYIDSQKDITLKFRGSKNQRLIDVKKSLKQNKIISWEN